MSDFMSDFIINTPNHKRWWLPDNIHMVNSFIYGNDCQMKVIDSRTQLSKQTFTVKLDNPQWQDLCEAFCEAAKRKYPRNILRRADAINRLTRGSGIR